jgi:predicted Zn-dependent protease
MSMSYQDTHPGTIIGMNIRIAIGSLLVSFSLLATASPSLAADDAVMTALQKELTRSFDKLKSEGAARLYFMSYRLDDVRSQSVSASYGSLNSKDCPEHSRIFNVEMRVGSPEVDNTHRMRGGGYYFGGGGNASDFEFTSGMPLDNDEEALRVSLWSKTDSAFKQAQDKFARLTANKATKVEEEDQSNDFSKEAPVISVDKTAPVLEGDPATWDTELRKLSAIFKAHPKIDTSAVSLTSKVKTRYYVNSEGTKIQDHWTDYRVDCKASAIADDGMEVQLYDYAEARSLRDLPDESKLSAMVTKLANAVDTLRTAPVAEPYTGPAILKGRAAAVFFHEIMGHRLEGHRQKDEGEGRTFAKMLGQKVLPDIISVVDDPTLDRTGSKQLMGNYHYDDEGVPAQRVQLVDKGVLKGFLMSRSPVTGFDKSNGHGRAQEGREPVARQGNLMVQPSERVPYSQLRAMLLDAIKKQNKPYGLIFDEISGGYTLTTVHLPQVFELKPLSVTRVWADGRPDELLRGVNLIGTPLASLETIQAAGDDDDCFNGVCGAESGMVPVSAVSPSLLVQKIEVERHVKAQEREPILPPPADSPAASSPSTPVMLSALEDEMARSKNSLQLSGNEKPFFVEYTVHDTDSFNVAGSFGAINNQGCTHSRNLASQVLMGDYKVSSAKGGYGAFDSPILRMFSTFSRGRFGGTPLPVDDNYFALRRTIWRDTDTKYKGAIENLAAKKAYLATNKVMDRPDDMSAAEPVVSMSALDKLNVDKQQLTNTVRSSSAIFRNYPHIQTSMVGIVTGVENRWYLNSEGFKNRGAKPVTLAVFLASANRDDGSKAADCQFITTATADQLPKPAEFEKSVKELADRVELLRTAKAADEDYDGPVLFEREAASQFLADTLAPQLASPTEGRGYAASKNQWREKIGLKVLPTFISIVDDPTAKEFANTPIYGTREIDDDGVRGEKLTLVDHGVLKTFCMSRTPTREVKTTNGHSLGGTGAPTNLFFMCDNVCTPDELKGKLILAGREQGLKYVYIIRRMNNAVSAMANQGLSTLYGAELPAMPPLCAYQVSTADGHEELVRDISFSHLTMRTLRNIEAAANDIKPFAVISMGSANTFAAPSILIKDMELQKRQGKPTKNEHILPNPYFESHNLK